MLERFKAYLALGALLAFLAAVGYAYHAGKQAGLEKAELDARRAAAQAAKTQRAIAEASEIEQERIRVVYRTIRKDVVRYVETHPAVECLDTQGVELINRAAKGDAP